MNAVIATGHVMRCLSIAEAVRERGEEVTFILSDDSGVPFISGRGFETMVLHTDWRNLEDGADRVFQTINGADVLLVDSYSESFGLMEKVRKKAYVLYMDDLNEKVHPADGLICYAPYFVKFPYDAEYPDVDLLLGMSYAPLRPEFADCRKKNIASGLCNILILSGGSDVCEAVPQILKFLSDGCYQGIYAICGVYSAYYDRLCVEYENFEAIHILKNVSELKRYMEEADLAVTAGGSTLFELCAVGTPAISYSFADNQLLNVQAFAEQDIIPYAGDFRYDDVIGHLGAELEKIKDYKTRRLISEKMQKAADGKGAGRIADFICGRMNGGA